MSGVKLKWRQLAQHQLLSQQGLILVHTEKLKPKGPIAEKLVSSDISHIALASVLLGENPSEELMIMIIIIIIIIIIINKSQELTVLYGSQKLTSAKN